MALSVRDLWHTCRPSTNGGTLIRCLGFLNSTKSPGRECEYHTRPPTGSPATYSSLRPRDYRKVDSGSVRRQTRTPEREWIRDHGCMCTVGRRRCDCHTRRAAADVPAHPFNHAVAGLASAPAAVSILSSGAFRFDRGFDAESSPHRLDRRKVGALPRSHSYPARDALRG